MTVSDFGVLPDGRRVRCLVVGREPGPVLRVLDLGATVHGLEVRCGDGARRDVVLAHGSVADYLASRDYLGSTVGRYANRIAGGSFDLDGTAVEVGTHDRGNHLHGGPDGFERRMWSVVDHSARHLVLALESPDGDQGFPGCVRTTVRFDVDDHAVGIGFVATTDAPTLVNLTNHAYFNLDGAGTGTIDQHELTVLADEYTPIDEVSIPLGAHVPVGGTPFDFRRPTRLGPALRSGHEQVVRAGGIDHNYVLRGSGLRPAAVLASRRTRTALEVSTDQPGLQVYTGNALDSRRTSATGGRHRQGDGIALEPQLFPDTPHHPEWPSAVLRPGRTYRAALRWRFAALDA